MRRARLLLLLGTVACGGVAEDPPRLPQRVVVNGQLKGETIDCGIAGQDSCYNGPLALEVWLLPRAVADHCRETGPIWCLPQDRSPLARAMASADGRFALEATEGEYRLAVVYHNTLRPLLWDEATDSTYRGDDGFSLTQKLFVPGEIFHFSGEPR